MKKRSAFLSLEYAVLIMVVVAALIGMSVYLKRAMLGKWRDAGDSFAQGRQYGAMGGNRGCRGTPRTCSDFFEYPPTGCQDGGGCSPSAPAGCYSGSEEEYTCDANGNHCDLRAAGCSLFLHYWSCEGAFSCADAAFQNNPGLCRSVGCQWTD